jgi:hypothetical protein
MYVGVIRVGKRDVWDLRMHHKVPYVEKSFHPKLFQVQKGKTTYLYMVYCSLCTETSSTVSSSRDTVTHAGNHLIVCWYRILLYWSCFASILEEELFCQDRG